MTAITGEPSKEGEYIPKNSVGAVTPPDGGTDEITVTATRLTNWPLLFFIGAALFAAYSFFDSKPSRR